MGQKLSYLTSKFNRGETIYNPTWFELIMDWIMDGPAKRQELENARIFQERLSKLKLNVHN